MQLATLYLATQSTFITTPFSHLKLASLMAIINSHQNKGTKW